MSVALIKSKLLLMSASDDFLFGLLDNAGVSGDARIMVMLSLSPDIELS